MKRILKYYNIVGRFLISIYFCKLFIIIQSALKFKLNSNNHVLAVVLVYLI